MRTSFFRRRRAAALTALAAAALSAWAAMPASVPGETLTGWVNVVWQTRGTENALADVGLFLVDERGNATRLAATPAQVAAQGGLLKLNGRRITVTGDLATVAAGRATPTLRVSAMQAAAGPRLTWSYQNQQGPRSYVTILCRFADRPGSDPHPASVYEQWMGPAYPGLDHYWRENSENRVSIGARVAGPFVLPKASSAYLTASGSADLGALAQDCTAAADASVDFTQFAGINMQFNTGLDGFSWGGSWVLTRDGQTKRWATTWMADWATQATYAHETGHSLGLPHSSGPYTATYDSRWDVMSGGGSTDPAVGTRVAPHTIAFHKDLLGWIPTSRKLLLNSPGTATIDLTRDELPAATGYQMAQIGIGGNANTFYTVEARRYAGYDVPNRLPGEAVIIHKVNLADITPAKVVDADGNGNPNDAGAMWLPGETFTDLQNGVRVSVLEQTADGYRVEVSTAGTVTVAGDSVLAPGTMGAPYSAQLSVDGGATGASWSVSGGALPRGMTVGADGRLQGTPGQAGTFYFTVIVTTPAGFGKRQMRLDVAEPQLAADAVMDQLLGTGTLTQQQADYLDLQGNANGRLDVGDVRAWLLAHNQPTGQ
jgi:M6 family metalloprotease-like protein